MGVYLNSTSPFYLYKSETEKNILYRQKSASGAIISLGKNRKFPYLYYQTAEIRKNHYGKYALRFSVKTAEKKKYTGDILAVGIGYDKETKKHECKVLKL